MINYELDGKVAVVTGGASGIGLACAHALARSGAAVGLWDLKAESLEAAVAELEQYGRPPRTAIVDVSDSGQVNGAMEAVANDLGRVDIVVANAGIGGEQKPTAEYSDASGHRVIGVNLDGVFYTQRAGIQAMRRNGGGSVINMASVLGQVGFAMSSAYVAAKHAVVGLTKAAAWEHTADGIRVNAVGPGFIMTPLLEANPGATGDRLPGQSARSIPNGSTGRGCRARRVAGQRWIFIRDRCLLPGGWRLFGPLRQWRWHLAHAQPATFNW